MTTPEHHPKSVLMDKENSKFDEFVSNIHNMSQFRFFMFILSIVFCFAFILIILFVVPCEWSNCISSNKLELLWSESVFNDIGNYYQKIFNYIKLFNTVCVLTELKGKPSIIELNQKLVQLVFIVKGSILNSQNVPPRTERFPSLGGGLLQIDTTNGKEMWRKRLDPLPDKIDCTLLNNQFKEDSEVYCIVGESNGNLLGVVSSTKQKGFSLLKY